MCIIVQIYVHLSPRLHSALLSCVLLEISSKIIGVESHLNVLKDLQIHLKKICMHSSATFILNYVFQTQWGTSLMIMIIISFPVIYGNLNI